MLLQHTRWLGFHPPAFGASRWLASASASSSGLIHPASSPRAARVSRISRRLRVVESISHEARALLKRAAETYLQGFEADWRDAYPGVNAVTLMEMMDKPDPAQARILPVVRFAAVQKARSNADYWDYATLLELAVLGRDPDDAEEQLTEALALARASWQVDSTIRNLRLMREVRTARGEDAGWIKPLEAALEQASGRLAPKQP